ncbi:TetR/AcrR family transcriptional regulator [Streptomyces humi]|uniref:TetR/AcrR family transcriptional regulator n=1 Tax=Streptomyces humi TaxID=1428620 RepID=UPI0006288873|nr:TetR/AcrR family transcriptional regulator [Streptomyces humi]
MPQISVRERLVDSAMDVFRRKGFSGASIQDVTEAAGVPKGSAYNHFRSKQDLAVEIVLRYARAADHSILEGQGPALERLRGHLIAQVERIRGSGIEFGCLLGTFASDGANAGEKVREAVREALDSWTDALTATIADGQASGEITTARSAATLAAFLLDLFEGATLRARTSADHVLMAEEVNIALEALRP